LEKQAYAMVKSLKAFRTYVLHSKIIAYMPSSYVEDILVKPDNDGRRGKWLAKIQEFDLEFKPTKIIKGQGLAKLQAKSNLRVLGINQLQESEGFIEIDEHDVTTPTTEIQDKFSTSIWYHNIVSSLLILQCPSELTPSKTRTLKLHAIKYCIIDGKLYWKDPLGFLVSCLVKIETERVIIEFHVGVCGGHHAWRATTYKILRAGYYWPKLFTYVNTKFQTCTPFQMFTGK
jgi:hypothetical protein